MNRVTLLGRLGQDPAIKQTPNGNSVVTFNLATTERWVKDGKRQDKTQWHHIVVWGRQAEAVAQYTRRGQQVLIEGRLETREWTDKHGTKHYITEVIAAHVEFLARPEPERLEGETRMGHDGDDFIAQDVTTEVLDDIPF